MSWITLRPSHLLYKMNDSVFVVVAHISSVKVSLGIQKVIFSVEVSGTHLARLNANLTLEVGS